MKAIRCPTKPTLQPLPSTQPLVPYNSFDFYTNSRSSRGFQPSPPLPLPLPLLHFSKLLWGIWRKRTSGEDFREFGKGGGGGGAGRKTLLLSPSLPCPRRQGIFSYRIVKRLLQCHRGERVGLLLFLPQWFFVDLFPGCALIAKLAHCILRLKAHSPVLEGREGVSEQGPQLASTCALLSEQWSASSMDPGPASVG